VRKDSEEEYGYSKSTIQTMAAILFLLATLAPFMGSLLVSGGSISVQLSGMTWTLWIGRGVHFSWNVSYAILTVPLSSLKFAFVYWFYRAYKGEKSTSSAVNIGIVSELVIVILNISAWLYLSYGSFVVVFPVSLTLLTGILMFRLRPPKQTATWMTDEEGEEWWSGSGPAESYDAEPESAPPLEEDDVWP
jgi:hypothetical protein